MLWWFMTSRGVVKNNGRTLTGSTQRVVLSVPSQTPCLTKEAADRKCVLVTMVTDEITALTTVGCWPAHQCTMGNGGGGTERTWRGQQQPISSLITAEVRRPPGAAAQYTYGHMTVSVLSVEVSGSRPLLARSQRHTNRK